MPTRLDQTVYRPVSSQNVSFTATAGNSTSLVSKSGIARIVATTDCYYNVGSGVTATTSNVLLPAYAVEYVKFAESDIFSFVRLTSDGTANVTIMSA